MQVHSKSFLQKIKRINLVVKALVRDTALYPVHLQAEVGAVLLTKLGMPLAEIYDYSQRIAYPTNPNYTHKK